MKKARFLRRAGGLLAAAPRPLAAIVLWSVAASAQAAAAAKPSFSPAGGTYATPQTVTISTLTPGAQIYYTIDGTTPTTGSPAYSGPIAVNASATVTAIAVAPGFSNSTVGSATYTVVPVLASLSVQAPSTTLAIGGTTQCAATGTYSDGFTGDLTAQVTWSSSDPAVASVSASGLVTGAAVGSATITATSGAITGGVAITVEGRATTYCYDAAGNMTARLMCATSAPCDARCP